MFGCIRSRTLAAPTSTEVSMNGYHILTALAAMRGNELIAAARSGRLVRKSRAGAQRSRPGLDHSAAPIPQPSSGKPTAGLVDHRDSDERHASSHPAEPVCSGGDRR